uniref:G_PROTEIN_RECEP_F1_2 domain-containing protein n=1 Tax=Magallana gigas TaxID=29159 RepID=K1PVA2_MAGGI|nr:QRFP-like peptide receptor [Crassostrea gigas]|eukprot:XP_011451485.1 PREDICTED: prolactin-releasing peptide receptor [Crassostrea gigas]
MNFSNLTNNLVENSSVLDEYGCPINNGYYKDFTQIPAVLATIIGIYIIVIVLAICGNMLVIWTVWKNNHMHTVTNYYIVNLAVSDFLVSAIVTPLKLLEFTAPCRWNIFRSDGLCSFMSYFQPLFVFVSVLTLVAISIERYYAIVHPLSAMKVNSKSRTKKIIAATWIIPAILATPYCFSRAEPFTISSELGTLTGELCSDRFDELDGHTGDFRRIFFVILFVVMYFIPLAIIVVTCTKIAICLTRPFVVGNSATYKQDPTSKRRHEVNKRKVARMVIVVAVAFIVAWSPLYIVSVVSVLQPENFLQKSNFIFSMLCAHLFGFINSCVNPFIYTVMSEKFRQSFKRTFQRIFCNFMYCRQTIFKYRSGSIIQRRSTNVTSATRSFNDEDEPLHNSSSDNSRGTTSTRIKDGSNSEFEETEKINKFNGTPKKESRVKFSRNTDCICISNGCMEDSKAEAVLLSHSGVYEIHNDASEVQDVLSSNTSPLQRLTLFN